MALCHAVTASLEELRAVRSELAASGITLPAILAATKADEAEPGVVKRLARAFPDIEVIPVSVLDDTSLEAFRQSVWRLTGLFRIFLRHHGETDAEPVALHPPATVADVARAIHQTLGDECRGARVWGPSARFDAQRVGRAHQLADGDTVEIIV